MNNSILKIIWALLMGFIIGMFVSILIDNKKQQAFDELKVLYEIRIDNDYINVRNQPTTQGEKLFEVLQDEEYEVIEEYLEDEKYNWYKIKFGMRRTGWVASEKENAWISIIEE